MVCWEILLAACILLFVTSEARPAQLYMRQKPNGPVNAGDSVSIECRGRVSFMMFRWRSVTVSWYRNGQKIKPGLQSELTFKARKEDDQAQYECRASNLRKRVTITVYYKPDSVAVSAGKTSTRAGDKDRFTCRATGGNPAPILRIYLKRSGGTPVEVSQGQDRVMAKADNQAEYYCEAKVPGHPALDVISTRKIYRVTFPFTKVSFTNNPTAAVAVGQVKMFTCETDETNLARVTSAWDQQINRSPWRRIGTGSASPGRRSGYGGRIMVDHFHLTATKAMHQSTVRCMMTGVGPGVYLRSTTTKMFVKWYMTELKMVEKPSGPVNAGVTVKIKCETDSSNSGFPGPILWYREGQRITSGVSASSRAASDGGTISVSELTFTVRKEDNQANYECKINDQASFRQDVNITVHFKPSKVVMIHKQLTAIHEGQLFMVACETDSANPPADIQFYRRRGTHREKLTAGIASHVRAADYNGKVRTTTVARIANRSDNQAVFECQVRDGSFHLQQAATRVTVIYKPDSVIVSAGKTSSRPGEKDRFLCNATGGNPVPTPRIYLKRSGGAPVEVSQGQDRVMVKADNQAEYYCEAKVPGYPALDVTSTRRIYRVTFPFTKVSFINPTAAVEVGQVKIFTCKTDESNLDGVTNTTWDQYIYGSSWRLISTGKATLGRSGVYGGRIMVDHFNITATKAMHQSIVRCQFLGKDRHGQTLISAITRMYVKWYVAELKMVEKPTGPVNAGVTVKIKCETDSSYPGTPGPILWYREGQRITAGVTASSRPASDGGTISVSELTFTARKEDNQANYECKINDQASFRQDVNITVHFKPSKMLMIHKPLTAIKEGKVFIITCTTDIANPAAIIQFYRRRGTNREEITKGIRSNGRTAGYGKIRTSTLVVTAHQLDNQAVFECQVRDGSFHLQQATTVTVYH